jgi:tetratricopeptide (TPR) repeat protein
MANTQRQSAVKATLREATLRLGNGEYPAAAALLRKALADDPSAAGAQRDLGIALMKSAQYAEAIQALDQALLLEDSAEVHQLLADAYRALGRPGDSAAHTALSAQAIERTKEARLRKIAGGR